MAVGRRDGKAGPDALRRAGEASVLVLISLAGGPKHGYALIQDIKELAGVELGPGTLYGALDRMERLDQAEPLQPVQRAVQRAGPELHVGQLLDVLDQRVTVLGSVGQAYQYQHRRLAGPAQHVLPGPAVPSAHGHPPS